jgi:MFS transporter, DHA1 family, multidrug resistance protein
LRRLDALLALNALAGDAGVSQASLDAPHDETDLARPSSAPLWLLALFTLSGTLGMHIFVPALPIAGRDLGAGVGIMQWTVSLYIFGLAIGQLGYGPISDRFGRRPTLLGGLALYTIAGLAAALAPGIHALIVARFFQAVGGCAGLVLGRAIVRDTAAPLGAARRLALLNLMVTLGPGAAPIVGGAMASAFGWRSIFFALTALGLVNAFLAWRLLPETSRSASTIKVATLASDYGRLLRSPAFLGYAIGGGCATTSMYAFIACAPFIFGDQLHRSSQEIGFYIAVLVSGVWLGSLLMSRLAAVVRMERLLIGANALSVVAALVFLAAVLSSQMSALLIVGAMFVFTLGVGIASPAALTRAISVNPRIIGSASGLYGFAQMAVGALCTALAGLGRDAALSAAIVLAVAASIGQASFWIALHWGKAGGAEAAAAMQAPIEA